MRSLLLGQQPATALQGGRDYPRNYTELRAWFPDDLACLDYLEWLRWPNGFICPRCQAAGKWRLGDGRFWCEGCHRRVSATSGTIFHRTRTPLSVWFAVAWYMTCSKSGIAALTLHRLLGFGSYQTAWTMLHRFRRAMVRPGRDRLVGVVEVDETYVGGVKPGKRGRGAAGKVLVGVAVERLEPKGFGRCRIQAIPNAGAAAIGIFLRNCVEPGSVVVTDGWTSYCTATGSDYQHQPLSATGLGSKPSRLLPGVHRVASLVKRWLMGTHQGAVEGDHIQAYLDEFAFRFNRRKADYRGLLFRRLLEQAVLVAPTAYQSLVANPAPKEQPGPPGGSPARALSLSTPPSPQSYPWREHGK